MEEKNINEVLWNKIVELNDLELKKSKILVTIFSKTSDEILQKKIESMRKSLEDQANFYNQNIKSYQESFDNIFSKYKNQINQIIEAYKKFFVNIQLELQEAECNQKIAITNYAKSCNIKQIIEGKVNESFVQEYKLRMLACYDKNNDYDKIISECQSKLNECIINMESKINDLFSNKSNQIAIESKKKKTSFFYKIINKFTGAKKFDTYAIEPTKIELEMTENKLPDIVNEVEQETIKFVAEIRKEKSQINLNFENRLMISVK